MEPTNNLVNPMLTDFYQITMSYAYWKAGVHEEEAVFDLFFRRNPFRGEFAIYAGLEEKLRLFENFHFSDDHIAHLKEQMPQCERGFFEWIKSVDCSRMKIFAFKEGTVSFPREPLMRVQGPIAVGQLLETSILTLTNYPSLMTTNAAKYRLAVGFDKGLIEFGLRRAQGPDGGVSASRYSYMGGFDGTSNVLAGYLFGVPIKGTHAHSYVQSFTGIEDLRSGTLVGADGKVNDFAKMVLQIRAELGFHYTNEGELASFIVYAQAFPRDFLALVDTYDTLKSGVPNFICVALGLLKLGYKPIGIRLDSGDLSYLSKGTRKMLNDMGAKTDPALSKCLILASNEINKSVLISLKQQGYEIDALVGGAIQFDQAGIERALISSIRAPKCCRNLAVDVCNCLQNTLAKVVGLVAVAQFDGLMLTGGCATRYDSPRAGAAIKKYFCFNGRITTRVEHLASANFSNTGKRH